MVWRTSDSVERGELEGQDAAAGAGQLYQPLFAAHLAMEMKPSQTNMDVKDNLAKRFKQVQTSVLKLQFACTSTMAASRLAFRLPLQRFGRLVRYVLGNERQHSTFCLA